MKKFYYKYRIALVLVALSALFYFLQNLLFSNLEESEFLLFQDIAFLPLDVLFVTFILESILQSRQKRERADEINIVISAFFSEIGADTIRMLNPYISNLAGVREECRMEKSATDREFKGLLKRVEAYSFKADSRSGDLEELKKWLVSKRDGILVLFENPNLLEDDRFTSLLWALYHVMDELTHRADLEDLPESDLNHLSGDIRRAYALLAVEWLRYMRHLSRRYPYLYSLALRTNPFFEESSAVINE